MGRSQILRKTSQGSGVNSSGVRQIAEAAGSGDEERMAQTAAILRRTSLVLGILGAVLLVIFAKPVAKLTFGNTERCSGSCASVAWQFCSSWCLQAREL